MSEVEKACAAGFVIDKGCSKCYSQAGQSLRTNDRGAKKLKWMQNQKVKNAVCIGVLCSVSYLAVYVARNILGAVTPQMIETGGFTTEYIGSVSSVYFICYAVGQLINGAIGDRIKARWMISGGLMLAGVTNFLFSRLGSDLSGAAVAVYGMTGFFLSMIYGPMTKVVAENTDPAYTHRCSIGYTFASFLGSPMAGVIAAYFVWQDVFVVSSMMLAVMSVVGFIVFLNFEKSGVIRYGQYALKKKQGGNIRVLIEHRIVKFTLISVITGVVRTSVVFWLPTYISQYLGFSSSDSAKIYTVATFVISMTTFVAIFVYERLHHNMDLTILLMFIVSFICFGLVYGVKVPAVNIVLMVAAIMSSNGAASMLWSKYCPSLRDTGMVSSATGFLDFMSYMAASVASSVFANAVSQIGWQNLILVWMALMAAGVIVALPHERLLKKR